MSYSPSSIASSRPTLSTPPTSASHRSPSMASTRVDFEASPVSYTQSAGARLQGHLAGPSRDTFTRALARPVPRLQSAFSVSPATPPSTSSVVQAPSSDLIFAFSPSLQAEIAQHNANLGAACAHNVAAGRTRTASERLQDAVAGPSRAYAPYPSRPPLRPLASGFSFDSSSSVETRQSAQSLQTSIRSSEVDEAQPSRSPSPEGFALGRWLDNDARAPQRRPSTPMPPVDTTQDTDSDSDITQGPCAPIVKRQRRG